MIVAGLSPAAVRFCSTLSRATCRWISRLTRASPTRASSSASSSASGRAGGSARAAVWAGACPCGLGQRRIGAGRANRVGSGGKVASRRGRLLGRPRYGAQLCRRGHRGVAGHPHGQLTETARGRGDLGQRGGIGRGPGRALGDEPAQQRGRCLTPPAPERGRVEEGPVGGVERGIRHTGAVDPVGGRARSRLGDGGGEGEGLGPSLVGGQAGVAGHRLQGGDGAGEVAHACLPIGGSSGVGIPVLSREGAAPSGTAGAAGI